ncbi:MAG: OsmC family peroxiredoxin [Limisphaerales bacterium]
MKPYTRKASVLWLGTRQRGKGALSTPSAALKMALYAACGGSKRRGINPPELIAAAHAGSFSMTLANELSQAGYHPRQIDTTATVTMEDIAAGWTMTQIYLDVTATVPKVAHCDFVDAALRAKANCPISRSLNANISMRATLSQRDATPRLLPQRNWSAAGPGILPKIGPRRNGAKN